MTNSATAYRAVLKPAGTPLVTAKDIRLLDIELTPSNKSLYKTAIAHLRETDCIDTYAFENHWELYYVHQRDTPAATQLRDALHAVPYSSTHWDTNRVPLTLELLDDHTNHWHSTSIGTQEHTMKSYNRWRHDLADSSPTLAEHDEKYLHEAMVRGVADIRPYFAERVFTNPIESHDAFLELATENTDTVMSHFP